MLSAILITVGLLNTAMGSPQPLAVTGEVFAPRQLSKAALPGRGGWELLWHRNMRGEVQLVAFERTGLKIKRLNPWTGGLITEKQLQFEGAKAPTDARMISTRSAELLVAVARDRVLELISDRSDFKLGASLNQDIRSLELLSLEDEVFVVAATINSAVLFKRQGQQLVKVASVESQPLLRRVMARSLGTQHLVLALLGSDQKMRLFQWDNVSSALKEGPSFAHSGDELELQARQEQAVFVVQDKNSEGKTTALRVYNGGAGDKLIAQNVPVNQVIGPFVFREDGRLLIPARQGERSLLLHVDPISGQVAETAGLGDARRISDLSVARLGAKDFYLFARDSQIIYIQNDNETSILPAPPRTSVQQLTAAIRLNNGQAAIAILGEGPTGTGVSVMALTR